MEPMRANSAEVYLAKQGKKAWQLKLMAESAVILRYGCEYEKNLILRKSFFCCPSGRMETRYGEGRRELRGKDWRSV